MKIIKKVFVKDRKGMIQVKLTQEEDTWYLYNIIKPGDVIKMKVQRKVKVDTKGEFGVKKVSKKQVRLVMLVLRIDFLNDENGTTITIKTKNLVENQYVMKGQVQNVTIPMYQTVGIQKFEWLDDDLELIDEACDNTKNVDAIIMLYDDGYCGFYQLCRNFTKNLGKLTKAVPKKQKNLMEFYKKSIEKFDQKVYKYILEQFDLEKIKVIVVGGPGNPKQRFINTIKNIQNFEKDLTIRKQIENNASKFIAVQTSSTFKDSINEILQNPTTQKLLGDTKALQETVKLDNFFKTLDECPNKVVYGEKEVTYAIEEQAIKDLLICSDLLKSHNFRIRKKFINLIENAKNSGAQVFVLNIDHPSGQKLKDITGIAAILRYELDLEDIRNISEESQEEINEDDEINIEQDLNESFINEDISDCDEQQIFQIKLIYQQFFFLYLFYFIIGYFILIQIFIFQIYFIFIILYTKLFYQ